MADDNSFNFFKHPEYLEVLQVLFNTLIPESDRGAVLVGTSIIDAQMRKLFEEVAPPIMSKKS